MAFRFLVSMLVLGFVAAADYDYNNPNTQFQSAPQFNSQNTQFQSEQQLNNIANDINSFSAATTIDDSQPTPAGYDYAPQAVQQPQQMQQTHSVASNPQPDHSQLRATQPNPSQLRGFRQQQVAVAAPVEYWPPAKYDYSYGVNDAYSGDIKSHSESRDGNYVRGTYRVVDPDGYERIVTYTADDVNGFNAVVNRKPYASAVFKSTPVMEFHQRDAAVLPTVANTQLNGINNNVDATGQPRDSYATPPSQHQNDGPYP